MNAARCDKFDYFDFLVVALGPVSSTETARVRPHRSDAPAHDVFTRLLTRLEPDPESLWREADPPGVGLVTRHWSCLPNHFWEMLLMAEGRGFTPRYVLFDGWYASLENLERVRDHGWRRLTRLKADRVVSGEDRVARRLDEVAVAAGGTTLHLRGYGLVKVFRIDAPDGDTEYQATDDLAMDASTRQHHSELGFAIEDDHRELKQDCKVEKCRARSERAQRNHIGLAIRAFLRLEWHFFTTGVSGFGAKLRLSRDAVRSYLARPFINLPEPSTV